MAVLTVVISVFVIAHFMGAILFLVNALYVFCTRGFGSSRISEGLLANIGTSRKQRCCLIRNSFACNVFILYHIGLLAMEAVGGMACEVNQSCEAEVKLVMWLLVGVTYVIIFLCFFSCYIACDACESHEHIGPISNVVAFELLHAMIFWFSIILLIGGGLQSIRSVELYVGLFIIGITYIYGMTWMGSLLYYKRHILAHKEIFSKQEAIGILNQQLLEPRVIEIQIKCFCHPELTNGSKFLFMSLNSFGISLPLYQ